MLKNLFLSVFVLTFSTLFAQQDENLPANFTEEEEKMLDWYNFHTFAEKGITTPPPEPVRTMAEWEEIQALCITWTQYRPTLAEIIRHAKEEVEVIVLTTNPVATENQLLSVYNLPDLDNVTLLETDYNSIWMRDYGPNTIYFNDVDSLNIVDWIYNRPRPLDDVTPDAIGELVNVPVYTTTEAPLDFVNTGGNFMSDGMGTGFASDLILDENAPNNDYNVTPKTEDEIDAIMQAWHGLDRYIKMPTLPYDVIHHIDMHMKLLDEETLLVGEYPAGTADGPQIEANLNYILDNFNSSFGTPYKVVRIPMPPDDGAYPNTWWADYRTYTNSVFVNNTILVPIYEEQFDTTALRIYEEAMPGYNVVGIDCNDIIESLGALHCITRAVGVADPLLINHQEHPDELDNYEDHEIVATIKHKTGISEAILHWTLDVGAGYNAIPMSMTNAEIDEWTAFIPNQAGLGRVYYYIEATANNSKNQVRPLVAPVGYFDFISNVSVSTNEVNAVAQISDLSPNPTSDGTSFTLNLEKKMEVNIELVDVLGRLIRTIQNGEISNPEQRFMIETSDLNSGIYFVNIGVGGQVYSRKLVVK